MKRILIILLLLVGVIANGQMFNYYHQRSVAAGSGYSGYPSVIDDGNTYAWYEFDVSNMTIDAGTADSVQQWNDISGNGRHLTYNVHPPIISGDTAVYFDGNTMELNNDTVTGSDPYSIYMVVTLPAWSGQAYIFRTTSVVGTNVFIDQYATSEVYINQAASYVQVPGTVANSTEHILRVTVNGASSDIRLNEGSTGTGTLGTGGIDELTLGVSNSAGAEFYIEALMIRTIDDTSVDSDSIYNYFDRTFR